MFCFYYLHVKKTCFFKKRLKLGFDSAASIGGQGNYFPWPPLEAALPTSKICLLFKLSIKLLLLIELLLIILWYLNQITQRKTSLGTIFNI